MFKRVRPPFGRFLTYFPLLFVNIDRIERDLRRIVTMGRIGVLSFLYN